MSTRSPEGRCIRLAEAQYGVISRAQAVGAGMTRRMIESRLAFGRGERCRRLRHRRHGSLVASVAFRGLRLGRRRERGIAPIGGGAVEA